MRSGFILYCFLEATKIELDQVNVNLFFHHLSQTLASQRGDTEKNKSYLPTPYVLFPPPAKVLLFHDYFALPQKQIGGGNETDRSKGWGERLMIH